MQITNEEREFLHHIKLDEKKLEQEPNEVIDILEDCLSTICVKKDKDGDYAPTKWDKICFNLRAKLLKK